MSDSVTYEYSIDGADWVAGDRVTIQAPSGFSREYTVRFQAKDAAGNTSEAATQVVKIDTRGPIVTLTNRNEGSALYNEPVFVFSADKGPSGNEVASGPDATVAKLNGTTGAWEPQSVTVISGEPLPTPLSDGHYKLSVTATDAAGASATKTCEFDVAAPPITLKSASPWEGDIVGMYASDDWSPSGDWDSKQWDWKVTDNSLADDWIAFQQPLGFVGSTRAVTTAFN